MPRDVDCFHMSDWREWKSIAAANVRRFEAERDEPWHADALAVSREFLALFDRDRVSRADLAQLLTRAGKLPARGGGADSVRRALLRTYLAVDAVGFGPPAIGAGQLVIDPDGLLCVLIEPHRPAPKWIAQLEFEPMRAMANTRWWTAFPLSTGGAALLPEPAMFVVGRPDRDQLRELIQYSNMAGVKSLVSIFTELADEVSKGSGST
jgi:hypothetical protein